MALDKSHFIVGLLSSVGGGVITGSIMLLSWGSTYGQLVEKVDRQGKDIAQLRQESRPGVKLGDLCESLIGQSNKGLNKALQDQLDHCFKSVPAAAAAPIHDAESESHYTSYKVPKSKPAR